MPTGDTAVRQLLAPMRPNESMVEGRPLGRIPYMPASRRIEMMLLPMMLFLVFQSGASNPFHLDAAKFRALIADAIVEPVNGLDTDKAERLFERAKAEAEALLWGHFAGWENAKVSAVIFYTVQRMLDEGTIEMFEGAAFADALTMLVSMFEHAVEDPRADRSARKQAHKFRAVLTQKGFFR